MVDAQALLAIAEAESSARVEPADILAHYLSELLADHEQLAGRFENLNDCVELLAQHFERCLERLEIVEASMLRIAGHERDIASAAVEALDRELVSSIKPKPKATVENRDHVRRADALRTVPSIVRFLSVEPILDDLNGLDLQAIHWLITGGESGRGARPIDEAWVHGLRDRCVGSGVAFFFKQWGGVKDPQAHEAAVLEGRRWTEVPTPGLQHPRAERLS